MGNIVRFKKSNVPGKIPSLDDLSLGEIAINTHDGKLFTRQASGALNKIIEIGATATDNVLYVATTGDDTNSGKTIGQAFATVKKALSVASPGTTIFLKSGEYIEDNPLMVPARVAIVGDSLRTVTIRPANPTQDICWVNNGSYIFQLNFKGHLHPAAAVAFPPDGSAGYITTSPYVQAVTSITSTGTGMRIDGAVTSGLRSMVLDAYTQYNQGGIGIHMLNQGNAQLVSIFTICCDISFLCEDGGFCSITNSNSSFGNYGLKSIGASPALYRGEVKGDVSDTDIVFKNLTQRPNIGDAVLFAKYNQTTCERDAGLIVDSLAFDLLYQGNTQSVFSGYRYWAKDVDTLVNPGEKEETVAALVYAKSVAQSVIKNITVSTYGTVGQVFDYANPGTTYGERVIGQDFDLIGNIIANGPKANAIITGPDITQAEPELRILREQIISQKSAISRNTISYIDSTYPNLEYDRATCQRDVEIIIEATALDLIFGSNYQTITAGLAYLTASSGSVIPTGQVIETVDAILYAKSQVSAIINESVESQQFIEDLFDIIADIVQNGESVAPVLIYPSTRDLDENVSNAKTIIQANKEFIALETALFVNLNYPLLTYSQATCQRDVTYILDAICYDLMYGGNSQIVRASERYYSYITGALVVNPGEYQATLDGYAYTQLLVERIVINDDADSLQSPVTITQDKTHNSASFLEVTSVRSLFTTILAVIKNGVVGDSDTIIPNIEASSNTGIINTYQLLQSNRTFIIDNTIAFINDQYPGPEFTYNELTCRRDLGYIIDSISFDLLHGGNRQSVQSGIYYYGASTEIVVNPGETVQTVASLQFLKELLADIITTTPRTTTWQSIILQDVSLPAATLTESVAINQNIDEIISIINTGPAGITKSAISLIASNDSNVEKAFNLLLANKEFIKKEMIAYINRNWFEISDGASPFYRIATALPLQLGTTSTEYPNLTAENAGLKASRDVILTNKNDIITNTIAYLVANFFENFVFDKSKCHRDVGIIIDAVCDDLVFDTNYRSAIAGYSYLRSYTSKVINEQKTQTVAALEAAKQFTSSLFVATPLIKTAIESKFDIVIDIISNGVAAVPSIEYTAPNNVEVEVVNSAAVLQANREFVVADTIAYIEQTLNAFAYDQILCSRDIGYIVDAVAYDTATGSNFQSIIAGRSYLRSSASAVLTQPHKTAMLDALKFIKQAMITTVANNSNAVTAVSDNVDIIIDIIDTGMSAIPSFVLPSPSGVAIEIANAVTQLGQNRTFIQSEIIAYVNNNTPPVGYNQSLCSRDVGYIVDALQYDLLYSSSWASTITARSYFSGAVGQLGLGEDAATIAAYTHLRLIVSDIVQGIVVVNSSGNTETQDTSGGYATINEATELESLVQLVIDVIVDGGISNLPVIVYPNTTGSLLNTAKTALLNSKQELQTNTVTYINTKPRLEYNQTLCSRDVGMIIDALRFDMMFGSNFQSIKAAQSYYRAQASDVLTDNQKSATIDALLFVKSSLLAIVAGNALAESSIESNMSTIIDIISNGINAAPAYVLPEPINIDPDNKSARDLIVANAEFLVEELEEFMTINYPDVKYNRELCRRDVNYIIDAINYDLTYGGNSQTKIAADAYFSGTELKLGYGEKDPTIQTYDYLQNIIEIVGQGNAVTALQSDVVQILGLGSSAGALAAANLVSLIKNRIDGTAISITDPDISWVTLSLIALNNSIVSAISAIKTNTIADINSKRYFVYNQNNCARDVRLIVDALTYDLLYGGNTQTIRAATAYFTGAGTNVITGEINESLLAYIHMSEIVQKIVRNIAVVPVIGNTEVQDTGLPAGDLRSSDILRDLMISFNAIVKDGPNESPIIVNPIYDNGDSTYINVRFNLQDNKFRIQAQVLEYIESRLLTFNKAKCGRDVGYIVESVCYDMIFDSNYQSIRAGSSYLQYAAAIVQEFQLGPTIASIDFVKSQCTALVAANSTAVSRLTAKFDLIKDIITNGVSVIPAVSNPSPVGVNNNVLNSISNINTNRSFIKSEIVAYIADNYPAVTYNVSVCQRDIDILLDAITYDLLYSGNSQSKYAAEQYFSGGKLQIDGNDRIATVAAYAYMDTLVQKIILNSPVIPLQNPVVDSQDLISNPAATNAEVLQIQELFNIITDVVENGYTSVCTLDATFADKIANNTTVSFHQASQITASGHTFEWIGAGIDINAAVPYNGGVPISENEIIKAKGGEIYYTSTDQKGDFKIGAELTIQRDSGSIIGRAFNKSLLAVITPYILALEG